MEQGLASNCASHCSASCKLWWVHAISPPHFPCYSLTLHAVAGYTVCATYSSVDPTETVFSSRLDRWIKTFYSIAVILNIITTTLMAYRIWIAHKRSISYVQGKGQLLPILRILVESAALQLIVEIILLALYCSNINGQYIVLESVASIVVCHRFLDDCYILMMHDKGITFNAITIRIRLHLMAGSTSKPPSRDHHVQTIGSMPLRRIEVNITQDVEENSYTDYNVGKLSHTS